LLKVALGPGDVEPLARVRSIETGRLGALLLSMGAVAQTQRLVENFDGGSRGVRGVMTGWRWAGIAVAGSVGPWD
jgi:hypothetical protein